MAYPLQDEARATPQLEEAPRPRNVAADRRQHDRVTGAKPEAALLEPGQEIERRTRKICGLVAVHEPKESTLYRASSTGGTGPVGTFEQRVTAEAALHEPSLMASPAHMGGSPVKLL
jgi:hypothetical protein